MDSKEESHRRPEIAWGDPDEADVLSTIRDLAGAAPGESAHDVERQLRARGVSAERARALVLIVPEALAIWTLRDLWREPPTEFFQDGVRRMRLAELPLYVVASRLAPALFADEEWRELANIVASRSQTAARADESRRWALRELGFEPHDQPPPVLTLRISLHQPQEQTYILDFGGD